MGVSGLSCNANKLLASPPAGAHNGAPWRRTGRCNPGRKRRNIAAGFYDEDGYFHPIRASYDYSPGHGGDKARKAPAKKKKAKAKTKKRR